MTSSLHALHDEPRERPSTTPRGTCTAHFGELHGPILEFIAGSEVLVGCVAWITSAKILDALASKQVSLVVQKESWWKKRDARGTTLARRYAALSNQLTADQLPPPLAVKKSRGKLVMDTGALAPISCVGHGSSSNHSPLMHHKFVVRCTVGPDGALIPLAVWTGSFNFSANANDSFENAVEIHDQAVAEAYLNEFALVASLAEPMNWRLSRPNPKGASNIAAFAPLPPAPKPTTTNVVKKGAARKRTSSRPSAKKSTARSRPGKSATTRAPKPIPAKKSTAPVRKRKP